MRIINLTPHTISVHADGRLELLHYYPSSLGPARVTQTLSNVIIPGADDRDPPVARALFGAVVGLPAPVAGTWYIVSQFVQAAAPERSDLLRADSGPDAFRDEHGQVVAVRRLLVR